MVNKTQMPFDSNFMNEGVAPTKSEYNWRLTRDADGLVRESMKVLWLDFNHDTKKFIRSHRDIAVGRSLMMSPFTEDFTWHTAPITEVYEKSKTYFKFNTLNGLYYLSRL